MCVEYDAHLRFKPGEPEPDKKKIKMLIIEMNLSTILAHVRKLEPLCFRKTTEVTMTQKQEKRGASIDPDEDIFEAAIDAPLALPPPEEKEEEEPPLALPPSEKEEVKEPVQTLPVLPLEEEKKKPQKIKLEPEKEKPKEEPQPEPEEPPKKEKKPKKKRESKKVKPKKESKAGKLNHDYAQVQSSDIYVALKLDDVDLSPTPEDFEKLRQETREFFMWRLKEFFPTQFVKLDLAFVTYEFGAGKPDSRYNVYVEWDIRASFVKSLTETEPAKEVVGNQRVSMKLVKDGLPTPYELTRALVQNVPLKDYLLKYVRQIRGTGFETTTAGYFQQRVT